MHPGSQACTNELLLSLLEGLNPTSLAASVSSALWVTMSVEDRGTRLQIRLFCQLLHSSGTFVQPGAALLLFPSHKAECQ